MFSQEIFAARLKILRKERNLTLEKLGNEIGVSKQAVGRWEKGEREPCLGRFGHWRISMKLP